MPATVAASLGVDLDDSRPVRFEGLGGRPVIARYGLVTLELRQRPKAYRWTTRVGFVSGMAGDPPGRIILGHVGFFRYFRAAFDHQRNRVEIRPNGLFSRVADRGDREA